MKKIFLTFLCICFLLFLASCEDTTDTDIPDADNREQQNKDEDKSEDDESKAPTPQADGFIYTLKDDGSYSIALSAENTLTAITIPKEYNGAYVTEISVRGFYKSKCSEIIIPETVKIIGKESFYECDSLKTVTISDGTMSIDDSAFRYCKVLNTVNIPQTLKSIGMSAFEGCDSLTEITIPISVTEIAAYAFAHCSALTIYCESVNKPATWNTKWNSSSCPIIWDCKNASQNTGFIIYNGLRYEIINNEATVAIQAKSIKEAIIPDKIVSGSSEIPVTKIAENAFNACEELTNIIIPNSVKEIGNQAFLGCVSLTKVVIPISVLKIGEYAFSFCNNLTLYCEAEAPLKDWSLYFTDKEPVWGYKEN